jgi:hypothetical protein
VGDVRACSVLAAARAVLSQLADKPSLQREETLQRCALRRRAAALLTA